MKGFRPVRWGVAVLAILTVCAWLLARLSVARVASATRSDLENVLDMMVPTHLTYLGARMAVGIQLAELLDHAAENSEALHRLAEASLDHFPGIGAFVLLRAKTREPLWAVPELPAEANVAAPLAVLEASAQREPGLMASALAHVPGWGPTLFLRLSPETAGGEEALALVEAVLLAPFYETILHLADERLDFSVQEGATTIYERSHGEATQSPAMR